MEQLSAFERLSNELSSDDRHRMLASIRASMESQAAPIVEEPEDAPLPVEEQLKVLGLWRRVLLFFAHVFGGRDHEDVVRQWMLRDLEQEVHRRGASAIDGRRHLFLEPFWADLRGLSVSSQTMSPLLRTVTAGRQQLVIALAMELFPAIHAELLRRTGGEYIESLKDANERTLRRRLLEEVERSITNIPPDARSGLRRALSQGDTLVGLASVGYETMISSFEKSESGEARCAFDYLNRALTELYRRLVELRDPVDLVLLQLLVMLNPDRAVAGASGAGNAPDEDGADAERSVEESESEPRSTTGAPGVEEPAAELPPPEASPAAVSVGSGHAESAIRTGLAELLGALSRFREFAQRYPLLEILRITRDDPWWSIGTTAAGEDWIGLYRSFFSDRIHREVLEVSLNGQLAQRLSELRDICDGLLSSIENLPMGENGVASHHRFLGVALRSLATAIFPNARHSLRIILTSGEFYKSSNRAQFNDAYEAFERLPTMVDALEHDLEDDQAWGSVLSSHGDALKRTEVGKRVDRELQTIADFARTTVEVLVNILGGILYARPGSSYDTLANYGQIGGRRNSEFIDELKELHQRLGSYVTIAGEIDAVERRAIEHNVPLRSVGIDLVRSDS